MLPGILAFLVPDVLPPGSAGDDADSFHFEPIGPFRGDVRALLRTVDLLVGVGVEDVDAFDHGSPVY